MEFSNEINYMQTQLRQMDTVNKLHIMQIQEKAHQELKELVNNMFGDSMCDVNIDQMATAFLNVKRINSDVGRDHIEGLSKVCNELNGYFQEIFNKAKKYNLRGGEIETFENSFLMVCQSLQDYIRICNDTFILENIQEIYNTVLFNHITFTENYEKAKQFLRRRDTFSSKQRTRYSYIAKGQSFIKWIWNYKYALYISGKLLYNTTVYVFPENHESWLNSFFQIFSMLAFTLANDRIMLAKFVKFVISSFTSIIANFFTAGFINVIIKSLPKAMRKTFEIAGIIVFYLIMEYAIDTLHIIAQLTCKTIILGGISTSGANSIIKTVVDNINEDLSRTKEGIEKLYTEVGLILEKISISSLKNFMSSTINFFYDTLENIIKEIKNIPSSIASTLWKKVVGTEKRLQLRLEPAKVDQTDRLISALTNELKTPDITDESLSQAVNDILVVNSDELQNALRGNINVMLRQSNARFSIQLNTMFNTIVGFPKKAYNLAKKMLENRMREMGTLNMWNHLTELDLDFNTFIQYIIPILLVIDLLSVLFSD